MKIKDHILVLQKDDEIFIGFNKWMKFKGTREVKDIIIELVDGADLKELYKKYDDNLLNQIINKLNDKKMLINDKEKVIDKTFLRNFYYYDAITEDLQKSIDKLENTVICIIGMGGIGGNIFQMLLNAGFIRFILIDNDNIEETNLNRQQIYNKADIGKYKVDVGEEIAYNYNGKVIISKYKKKITNKKDIYEIIKKENPTLIVQAADTPIGINEVIMEVSLENNIPIISGGVHIHTGKFRLFNIPIYSKKKRPKYKVIKNNIPKASLSATNNIIASLMAHQIIQYVLYGECESLNKTIEVDFRNLAINKNEHDIL